VPDDAEGFLFTPVDSPTISEPTVAILIDEFRARQALFAIPRFDGRRGHPVCAARSTIVEFLALAPTAETREIVNRHEHEIAYIDVDDAGVLADIDDFEAYRRIAP
ncbi:MAG TPA: NTP transferase domain-containing protein, partial [Bryobacteraceae bacterium]|nr:NTP transferase domain-containing protein [Bryobacteraceae bacterium]